MVEPVADDGPRDDATRAGSQLPQGALSSVLEKTTYRRRVQRIGDVLLAWENEAFLAQELVRRVPVGGCGTGGTA